MRHRILGRTLAEPVHPAHPVGHQVRPVRGQPGQLDHQLIRGGAVIRARSRRIRAMPAMTRASLASVLPSPPSAPARPETIRPGDVDHVLAAGQQHCQQQRCHRADQIHRPPLAARLACPGDQLNPPLLIGDPHRPQQPAISVNRRSVVAGLPGIHTSPDHNRHPGRPLISAGQPRGQPRRQVPKQRRLASDLNQRPGSPGQRGGHSPRATTTATSHQPPPAAPGIQGTNPGQLRP